MERKKVIFTATLIVFLAAVGLMRTSYRDGVRLPVVSFLEGHGATAVWQGALYGSIKPVVFSPYTQENPAPSHAILQWSRVDGAVMYDVQIVRQETDGEGNVYYREIMPLLRSYATAYEAVLPKDFWEDIFYWRVRGVGLDGPVSDWSELKETPYNFGQSYMEKPILLSQYNCGNGTVLLYPVYDWVNVPGAARYEVEILDGPPENPNGVTASCHRIDVLHTETAEVYDTEPRYGARPFYWRVLALDEEDRPIGVYSDARQFTVNPDDNYTVVTLGDSISHGGGSISYSPTDWEFDYQYYLAFPSLNAARSGDTSRMTAERFEADVLPFKPQYVLILMGSNSLRGGVAAENVIRDMETVRLKCLQYGIRPVFLTIPPVNPGNIYRAFKYDTVADWQYQTALVNEYIRGHVHIDITDGMADSDGNLRNELALDGLHLDPPGKKMIGDAINRAWPNILEVPPEAWSGMKDVDSV
ncbi:SGNH/GDSL hydrolase family protein [Megasphaera coli]|uniref:SGNH/GDSL hydrolase family protein n=1 Tax=Colibacter massiliensis TaxID=1852379 RepID=UPI00094F334E|nr:GDSL-type esterase/lipase family protein [Colibacter massiliensis]